MKALVVGAVVLLAAGAAAEAAEPAVRNPFARPSIAAVPPPAMQGAAASAPAFSLRATLAAGAESLVNIDGEIVAIGEVYAGYRLVAVGEGRAVFIRNGVRFPLTVTDGSGDTG